MAPQQSLENPCERSLAEEANLSKVNTSPKHGTFHSQCKIDDATMEGRSPDTDPDVLAALDREGAWNALVRKREADPEWQKNNLEYDLRSTKWICDRAKSNKTYAQNLYAAMCNQDWQRNDVWPLLKGETWTCSWRYAGGIVAHMREEGDYIDWYCSGIQGEPDEDWVDLGHVPEGTVTDEIREDFFKLGWLPVGNNE